MMSSFLKRACVSAVQVGIAAKIGRQNWLRAGYQLRQGDPGKPVQGQKHGIARPVGWQRGGFRSLG
jgi:hypothetical protein